MNTQWCTHTHIHTHIWSSASLINICWVFSCMGPWCYCPRPLRWGEVRFGATVLLCHLDIHLHMHAHVYAYRYTLVITRTDKTPGPGYWTQRESWILCACLCVYIYISWVYGEYWVGGFSVLEAVFISIFFSFWALGDGGSFLQVSKNKCRSLLLQYVDPFAQIHRIHTIFELF